MSDTPLWLDAFPHDYDVAHERTVRGTLADVVSYPGARRDGGSDGAWRRIVPAARPPWTGVFASELVAGRLSVVSSWPDPHPPMVALGGGPYVVDAREPGAQGLGRLDDEVHLRAGGRLHRIGLRHGRTVTGAAAW